MNTVYSLINPLTKEIKYIGKTILSTPDDRLKQHINKSKNSSKGVGKWIKHLIDNNNKPKIKILFSGSIKDVNNLEIILIAHYKRFCNLTNLTKGGEGIKYKKPPSILQYSKTGKFIKEWENINAISKSLSVDPSNINRAYNKKAKTSAGYIWRISNGINKDNLTYTEVRKLTTKEPSSLIGTKRTDKDKKKMSNTLKVMYDNGKLGHIKKRMKENNPINGSLKSVNQYNLDGEFIQSYNNVKEAAKNTNIDAKGIYRCCLNKSKTSYGFIWKYINK